MSKSKTIPNSKLIIQKDTPYEQERLRTIFENIRERGILGKKITEHEKNFFGICIGSALQNEGTLNDFPFLENFKFKMTYLTYHFDISGGSKYYKLDYESIELYQQANPLITSINPKKFLMEVERDKVKNDLIFLADMADSWNSTIQCDRHTESLLKYVSKETRTQLVELENRLEFHDSYSRGTHRYKHCKRMILLQLKYIYLATMEIFETMKKEDFLLSLNGVEIEYNEYSIVHIFSRHFAALTKPFDTGKSYHNMSFIPMQLNLQLKDIFELIHESGLYINDSIEKISFEYKETPYCVHTNSKRFKQIKGEKENFPFTRVETFYPIEKTEDLDDLKVNYTLNEISSELKVYCKKI